MNALHELFNRKERREHKEILTRRRGDAETRVPLSPGGREVRGEGDNKTSPQRTQNVGWAKRSVPTIVTSGPLGLDQWARKSVFITASLYTNDAREYVSQIDTKVVLIDGEHLANLMIDFDIGVSTVSSYAIKRIDSDYFEED